MIWQQNNLFSCLYILTKINYLNIKIFFCKNNVKNKMRYTLLCHFYCKVNNTLNFTNNDKTVLRARIKSMTNNVLSKT